MLLKLTTSLCPECLADVPASVHEIDGSAIMHKSCPEHGAFESMVERDAEYYKFVQSHNALMFYSGLVVDVTYRCNLRCKWCFQHLTGEDVPKERIYSLVSQMPKGHNIILSGGEPTLRQDLPEIVQTIVGMGYTANVITNGFAIDWNLPCRWTLSHHPESAELFAQRVSEAREGGNKFASIIFTDNSLDDFYSHIQEALSMADVCEVFRMHAAAPVGGNLSDDTKGIFVSDMNRLLMDKGHEIVRFPAKTIFSPMTVDCVPFMLIAWNTAANVDVLENMSEPWYHGKGNSIDNLVTRIIRDH
jgi:organic radical activating enzyme